LDAAAHCFGGYRDGSLGKIFEDLGVDKKIEIKKIDPSNIIITPDYKVSFWTDLDKQSRTFKQSFPMKHNIKDFFYFLLNPNKNYLLA